MNRLIKNELIKIFHKKAIYIVLIATLGMMILSNVLNKVIESINIDVFDDTSYYEEEIKKLNKNNPEEREMYFLFKTNVELSKLKKQYGVDSWQRYIIEKKGYNIINNMLLAEGKDNYENLKNEYDKFVKRLENDDWKVYVNEELEQTNQYISELEKAEKKDEGQIKIQNVIKQGLEWRLQNDISYAESKLNNYIEQWVEEKQMMINFEETAKIKNLTHEEKFSEQENKGKIALLEYAIKNNKDEELSSPNNTYVLTSEVKTNLLNVWDDFSIMIIIMSLIIAGTIISEEFNKGTIKLLLVRPYKRTKILIAKFITCLIILMFAFISVSLIYTIVNGIFNGFAGYSSEIMIYNFKTNGIETISTIKYMLVTLLAKLPMYLLLMTLSFTISVVLNNSALAIAFPIVGTMFSEAINQIAYHVEKAQFLKFFVTPNWDLSMFLYGKMPQFEPISLPFSITICAIYFVIMIIVSLIVFKKRDIKNI